MSERYRFPGGDPFAVRGFNMCESLLRHTPEQLRRFLRRMKRLGLNSLIVHYDYGWRRYREIILEECRNAGVGITLMTFGPRTFFSLTPWNERWFAKDEHGLPFTRRLECETQPCPFVPEALDAFEEGAFRWLKQLPPEIKRVHMRSGDGRDFCLCPDCRRIPVQERWQPFVERFMRAVSRLDAPPAVETDIYIMRYEPPANRDAHRRMDRIMFDPFPRSPLFALCDPLAPEVHRELVKDLEAWARLVPGKVYIHENAMKQGFHSVFQHGTGPALDDLNLFRELGVSGVCYEAFEPGYHEFAEMFEILAGALNGRTAEVTLPEGFREAVLSSGSVIWGQSPDIDLKRFISDPVSLKNAEFTRRMVCGDVDRSFFLEYFDFMLEHREKLDWIYGCYSLIKRCRIRNIPLKFKDLSAPAADFATRRKLWDFMEDIPPDRSPVAECLKIIEELRRAIC